MTSTKKNNRSRNKKRKQNKIPRDKTRKENKGSVNKIPADIMKHMLPRYLTGADKTSISNVSKQFSNIFKEEYYETDILLYISEQLAWFNNTKRMALPKSYIKNATSRVTLYIEYDDETKNNDTMKPVVYITSDGQYAYDLYDGVLSIEEFDDVIYQTQKYQKLSQCFDNIHIERIRSTGDPLGNINNAVKLLKEEMHKCGITLKNVEFTLSNMNLMKEL